MTWKDKLIAQYSDRLKLNFSLRMKSSLRTGGQCECFLEVNQVKEIIELFKFAQKENVPLRILGRGSNTLIADGLIEGLVIQLGSQQNDFEVAGEELILKASTYLSRAIQIAHEQKLIGLEFVAGIPGTIGGAVMMNAGTKLGEMGNILKEVFLITAKGVSTRPGLELGFSYRHSNIAAATLIYKARLQLKKASPPQLAKAKMKVKEYLSYRRETQPLDKPTLGSTFVNPPGHQAAKLIEDCGLKGFAIGGIYVSKLHANFIVNEGQGNSTEAWELIKYISQEVKKKKNIELTPEVKLFGF